MTRRTAARDLLLLLVAAALIAAMASLGRGGPRAATCRQHGCLVNEIKQALAWRDAQRVDSV